MPYCLYMEPSCEGAQFVLEDADTGEELEIGFATNQELAIYLGFRVDDFPEHSRADASTRLLEGHIGCAFYLEEGAQLQAVFA